MISVPVMSLGIRSGVNWIRLKLRSSASASGRTIRVLASPGTPIEQGVAAGEDGGQDPVDDVFLAHDALGHLALEPGDRADQALELLDVVVGCGLRSGHDLSTKVLMLRFPHGSGGGRHEGHGIHPVIGAANSG